MKRFFLAAALITSPLAYASNVFLSSQVRGRSHDVEMVGKDEKGFFALKNGEKERFDSQNICRKLYFLEDDILRNFVQRDSIYFVVNRFSDDSLKLDSFLRIKGGHFGDDMSDSDYRLATKLHGSAFNTAKKVVTEQAKRGDNIQNCVVGAAAGIRGGVVTAVAGCVNSGVASAVYNAVKDASSNK